MITGTHHTLPDWTAWAKVKALLISEVIMPEASPYVVLLARSITSSSVENFMICWTGPKI